MRNVRTGGRWRLLAGVAMCSAALLLTAARSNPTEAPLADAVMRGDTAKVRVLIKQGADVNASQPDGMSALHWASQRGDLTSAKVLVYAGARVDAVTRNGNYTPLHLAAREGRAALVKLLLEHGASGLAVTSTGGATALHFAAGNGNAETVQVLLGKGVPVDVRETAWGQTPLMWAAAYNRVAALDALIKAGAGLEAASKIDDIPKQEREIRTVLVARSRRVAALKSAESPLAPSTVTPNLPITASSPGAGAPAPVVPVRPAAAPVAAVPAAVSAAAPARPAAPTGAAAGAPRATGDSARPQTGFQQRGPSYGELIGNKGGLTPLLFAVREGHVDAVERLLAAGANINHVSEGDHTSPLLMAAVNGRFDLAKLLVDKGADVKLASDAGATPLYAVINTQWAPKSLYPQPTAQMQQRISHIELMEMMLKAGADPNVRLKKHLWFMSYNFDLLGVNTVGATPFWRAAYGLDVPAMKLLVQYKADPTVPTIKPLGRLPGDDAPEEGAAGGADPSGLPPIPDGGPGVYPIHAASGVGYGEGFAANSHRHAPDAWLPAVKYLIEELKADPNARDHNGYNPLHHAAARGDNELIQYLVGKGTDIKAVSRRGQTTADMANGPVQRITPFLETVELLVKLGSKNSNKCRSC
ncbi:ankyrin repeat domain-containing protein [Gemmatimonas phototrophica]|uniref:ankyrin repeat domain-containing protein n=1 Tax=Gemmatimonas phototrophica TaxID=1379270 RepID=UPI0005B9A35C|nr:ankyrin repeat domain-containing protein [Gemmatimonas phototrophica]